MNLKREWDKILKYFRFATHANTRFSLFAGSIGSARMRTTGCGKRVWLSGEMDQKTLVECGPAWRDADRDETGSGGKRKFSQSICEGPV